jgi:DNA modification methylase
MRYLVRLVTPPGGIVLDPFAGGGTTGIAAELEGFGYIMIEREEQYVTDMRRRLASEASLSATVASQADPAD